MVPAPRIQNSVLGVFVAAISKKPQHTGAMPLPLKPFHQFRSLTGELLLDGISTLHCTFKCQSQPIQLEDSQPVQYTHIKAAYQT